MINYDKLNDLPITPYLDEICTTLKTSPSRFLVLTAQTAAGKSTAVPVALLKHFNDKIIMLEPRRIAAVAIASRVAELIDEEPGQTSGYRLSMENCTSDKTRFEVCTEAILTRRLQQDPSLEGISVVVLDEFHERSIHADLALAFLKEAMALRDDLYVILMSATMDAKRIANYLCEPSAPVMEIPGRQFPVQIEYDDKLNPAKAIFKEFNNVVSITNERSFPNNQSLVSSRTDTILCFLPGIFELNKTKTELESLLSPDQAEIFILHSSIPLSEQKKILTPVPANSPRRIILSSAIAETSLTVPGVTTVIDSGLSRVNKMNIALGMEQLVTEKVSQFSADQRAGRAGRLMAGRCIRLWNKFEQLQKEFPPEILRSDLSSLVLECAQWGAFSPSSLSWLDSPSDASWKTSTELLTDFGFIKDSHITQKGKYALSLGISPRLACAALYSKQAQNIKDGLNFVLKFSSYKTSSSSLQTKFINILEKRLQNCTFDTTIPYSYTELLLSGFPDRLAIKLEENTNSKDQTVYQFTNGRKAVLQSSFNLAPEWLIAVEADAGTSTGKIHSYEKVDAEQISQWISQHSITEEVVSFAPENRKLIKNRVTKLGHIILKTVKLNPSPEDFSKAVCNQIIEKGIESLPLNEKINQFINRAIFYSVNSNDSELINKLQTLSKNPQEWLLPFLTGNSITSETVYDALYWYLNGSVIDEKVPHLLVLENGKKAKIQYKNRLSDKLTTDSLLTNVRSSSIQPVLEIIIQQIFGCFTTPRILNVPVLLMLLSPARRPLQITDDLEHFWSGAWIEICKEMKGRYPKHNWDYRIAED